MSHDFESEMTAHWLQSDIGPRQAAAKLQPVCGDVEPLSEQTIRELEAEWQEKRNAFYAVLGILGGPWNCLAGFDCEDVESPADHTHVVSYLAKATNGRFVVDGTAQTIEPNGDLTLNLLHRGNRYSCTFEDGGSWINLSGLLAGLNNILKQLGIEERFFELYGGNGNTGIVAFVLPDKFIPAARDLRIRLEEASSGK